MNFERTSDIRASDTRKSAIAPLTIPPPSSTRKSYEVSNIYSKNKQILATTCVTLGCLLNGASIGYTGTAVPSLMNGSINTYGTKVQYDMQQISWMASFIHLGCLFGKMSSGFLLERLGRKKTLLFATSISFLIGHLVIYFASSAEMLYIGRFFCGIGLGLELSASMVYITEISSLDMRVILGYFVQFMGSFGILFSFIMGGLFFDWNILILMNGIFLLPFVIGMILVPESPHWLIHKGYIFQASQSLEWLRGRDDARIEEEIDYIRRNLSLKQKERSIGCHLISECPKSFLVCFMLIFFWTFSGYTVFIFYSSSIFDMVGSSIDSSSSTITIGVILLLSCVVSIFTVPRNNRKKLMASSMLTISLFNCLLGFCVYPYENIKGPDYQGSITKYSSFYTLLSPTVNDTVLVTEEHLNLNDALGYGMGLLPLFCVSCIIFVGNIGFGTMVWTVIAEITPQKCRNSNNSLLTFVAFGLGFILIKTFVDLIGCLKESKTFWIYSAIGLCGFIYIVLSVPETKGKTNDEIKILFGRKPKRLGSTKSKNSRDIQLEVLP